MILKRHDRGDDVKTLQRGLNRLGSMLLIDGDFGDSTEAAVADARATFGLSPGKTADDALCSTLAAQPDPSLELTAAGVTFIGREEIGSPSAYRKKYAHPECPGEDSGVTIGIGYDLRFADRDKLEADWGGVLSPTVIARLADVCGVRCSPARLAQVADIEVPLLDAVNVFLRRMMPEHIGRTRHIYPTLDDLPANRRAALISLVFNRGSDLAGPRRTEMKRVQELLQQQDFDAVPEQFRSMTRLWSAASAGGLIERRQREATLWESGFRSLQLD